MPLPDAGSSTSLEIGNPGLHVDANGVVHSLRFADVYASRAGGSAQADAVYVAGVGLPARWANRRLHTILELGFGLGGNFLASHQQWLADPNRCQFLDYIGIERYPISPQDFERVPPPSDPQLLELWQQMREQWPEPAPGFHLLEFAGGKIRLILVFWDVLKALVELDARVDSVFLDGFAPSKNPEMWTPAVLSGVRRLLTPGARLASYSVAGSVREALVALGFEVRRKSGFGSKKQRLEAELPIAAAVFSIERCRRVAIVGAGIAGLALAEHLLRHGLHVTLFERASQIGAGASGVPAALLHPPAGAQDSFEFGLQCHAYRLTQQRFAALAMLGFDCGFQHSAIYEQRKNGRTVQHTQGGWLRPALWLASLLEYCQSQTDFRLELNSSVDALQAACEQGDADPQDRTESTGASVLVKGKWQAFDAVVLCNAMSVLDLLPGLTMRPVSGQVALLEKTDLPELSQAYCGQANIIPMQGDMWCVGNSYERGIVVDFPRDHIRDRLLQGAAIMLKMPELATLGEFCKGWVGTRVESNARLPLIGELKPGIWLDTAHASKGFMTAFLAAELIGARILGRASALPARLMRAVDLPGRVSVPLDSSPNVARTAAFPR